MICHRLSLAHVDLYSPQYIHSQTVGFHYINFASVHFAACMSSLLTPQLTYHHFTHLQ